MYITVKDALNIEPFNEAMVVAGHEGLGNKIKAVNIMDAPDITNWLKGGELLLTTAFVIKDDLLAQENLVIELSKKGCAALGIKTKRFLESIPEKMIKQANIYKFPLLELPYKYSFCEIMNPIMGEILNRQARILQRSEEIHNRFMEVVLEGGGLESICHTLAHIVENPVTLHDANTGELLVLEEFTRSKSLLAPLIEARKSETHKNLQNKISIRLDEHIGGHDINRYISPISSGEEIMGYISIWEINRSLKDIDVKALENASIIAALEMVKARTLREIERSFKGDFLDDLLSGNIRAKETVIGRATFSGLDFSQSYICMVLDVDEFEKYYLDKSFSNERYIQDLKMKLYRLTQSVIYKYHPRSIIANKSDQIVFLLPYNKIRSKRKRKEICLELANSLKDKIKDELKEISVSVGIGNYYPDILDIHKSYKEAKEAITIGRIIRGKGSVSLYEELGVWHLLYHFHTTKEFKVLYDNLIGELLKYDKQHNSELIKTLQVYFNNQKNLSKTAQKLKIHRNTLMYRLNKIKELLDIDLDDSEISFNLHLALKMSHFVDTK